MKAYSIIEEKITFILFQVGFNLFIALVLLFLKIETIIILLITFISIIYLIISLLISYFTTKKKTKEIINLVDNLDEKYLISEIIAKPKTLNNYGYYYALKKACKAMNDKISNNIKEREEYQEYIESFVHEIKTPISALSLSFDNNHDQESKEQIKKIDNLVEQILYYARSDNPEKDYFVKEVQLNELIHLVIINYKDLILKKNIKLNCYNLDKTIYTDEKWVIFIVSQIIQNAIKYLDKINNQIEIYAVENKNNLVLSIIDNGCGIKVSELSRVFEKGFTGSNRKKENATGIGLYLSKKLSDKLGLKLSISSTEKKFTRVDLVFTKGDIYRYKQ